MTPSAAHPTSLDVCAAQAAPRCVLVVAQRTPLWDSFSALRVSASPCDDSHPPGRRLSSRDFECTTLADQPW
jgi:hypothetical protein